MRTDLAPARFNWTHRFSQLVLNSDLNTDVNLDFTRMMAPSSSFVNPVMPV